MTLYCIWMSVSVQSKHKQFPLGLITFSDSNSDCVCSCVVPLWPGYGSGETNSVDAGYFRAELRIRRGRKSGTYMCAGIP